MRRTALLLLSALSVGPGWAACPEPAAVEAATESSRQELASALLDCLSEADPARRDKLGFDTLSDWLRKDKLTLATRQRLLQGLLLQLDGPDNGWSHSFSLLTLSEIARTDRLQPWLDKTQRENLLTLATERLRGWRDYRGFDEATGWRHGVAHGADLLLQLALNPALDAAAETRILDALATQVLADGRHAYQFGEGGRLARTALFALSRSDWTSERWDAYLQALAHPIVKARDFDAPTLARLHNLREFLLPMYFGLQEGKPAMRERYLPGLSKLLKRLP
ncbi:MAG TPA: DUF2785 domain-containing protein [Burkholderiaceae bacterium]